MEVEQYNNPLNKLMDAVQYCNRGTLRTITIKSRSDDYDFTTNMAQDELKQLKSTMQQMLLNNINISNVIMKDGYGNATQEFLNHVLMKKKDSPLLGLLLFRLQSLSKCYVRESPMILKLWNLYTKIHVVPLFANIDDDNSKNGDIGQQSSVQQASNEEEENHDDGNNNNTTEESTEVVAQAASSSVDHHRTAIFEFLRNYSDLFILTKTATEAAATPSSL